MAAEAIVEISCSRLKSAIGDEATKRLNYTADLEEMLEALEAIQPVLAVVDCQMNTPKSRMPLVPPPPQRSAPVTQLLPQQQRVPEPPPTPQQQQLMKMRMVKQQQLMKMMQQQKWPLHMPHPTPPQLTQQQQQQQLMQMRMQQQQQQQQQLMQMRMMQQQQQQQMWNPLPAPLAMPRPPLQLTAAVMQQQQQILDCDPAAPPVVKQPRQLKFIPQRLCWLLPCLGPFPRQQPLPPTATATATAMEPSPAINQGLSMNMPWPPPAIDKGSSMNMPRPREWVTEVREVAYRISYMVDELQARKIPAAGKMTKMLHRPASVAKDKMFEEMKDIKEKLRRLVKESLVLDQRDVSALQDAPAIVERDEDVDEIISRLFEGHTSEGLDILLIVGNGGIGKTTVADMVFHHPCFQSYSRVWVNMLQVTELHEIGNFIISQLSREEEMSHGSSDPMEDIKKRLAELFSNGTKVLIVLDSMGAGFGRYWKHLKSMLDVAEKGSQVFVIVTARTHFLDTFSIFGSKPYSLKALTDEMCCKIVKQAVGPCIEDLERITPEIAKHCGGFPLAAQLLGRLLRVKDYREWHKLLDKNRWSKYDPVQLSLELSYRSMPPDLKLCFAYCAMYLVGHPIAKDDLVHQWVALNLIEPSEAFSTTELADQHITRLLDMSFLQTTKLSSTSGKDEKGEILLVIHEEVDAFATRALGVDFGYLNGVTRPLPLNEHCRYAVVENFGTQSLESKMPAQKIRALYCHGCSKMVLGEDSFLFARCLRVLELQGSSMTKLPDSVCKLEHLGYLNLSGCSQLVTIPESFGNLIKLLHLDLSSCSALTKLPGSFGKLVKLVYINLSGCFGLENLPEFLGRLTSLVHVNLSGCSGLEKLPQSVGKLVSLVHFNLSGCSGLVNLPEFLGRLTNLEHINLSGSSRLEKLPMSFGKLTKLKHTDLSGCSKLEKLPPSFGKLISLVHINLSGCSGLLTLPESFGDLRSLLHINLSHCYRLLKLPESFANLKKLVHLDLSFWSCFEGIKTALDGLTNLQHLNLSHPCPYRSDYSHLEGLREILGQFTRLEYLNLSMFLNPILYNKSDHENCEYIECIRGFCRLKHLDLSHNIFLCDLPKSLQGLDRLQTLDLSGCIRLKKLEQWLSQMTSLKSIVLRNCDGLESCQFVVGDKINKYFLGWDISSGELEITCLMKMKTTVQARKIRLVDKRKLQKLKLCWTDGKSSGLPPFKLPESGELPVCSSVDGNDLLGELEPPHLLQCLEIHGYSSETCNPSWWKKDICYDLKNLTKVTMEDFPRCTTLPPLGLLQNLEDLVLRKMASIIRIDPGELSGGNKAAFQKLSNFTIDDMVSLEKFNTVGVSGGERFIFPAISQSLVVQKCPSLSFVPCLPGAKKLVISDCNPEMISCPNTEASDVEDLSWTSAPVTELVIEICQVTLGEWRLLHQLTGLRSLTMKICSDLISSEEIISALSSLEVLSFSFCNHMSILPEHLGDLSSLRDLHIENCEQLKSLPESMQRLSSLQSMHFADCHKMKELPEWLGRLTSLQKLSIKGCPGMKSLPQSTYTLINLKDFDISGSTRLKKWCDLEENKKFLGDIQPKYEEAGPGQADEDFWDSDEFDDEFDEFDSDDEFDE